MPACAEGPSDDKSRYRTPIGTPDVLPPESARGRRWSSAFAERAARFGYGLVVTPIFEHIEVFQRVGESTDVVRKEMYEFDDKGGRRLALRPEGTASVVRAFVQHHPTVAVEGLVRRAELPLRAAAEGPVPPALAGRRRGARRRRPRQSTSRSSRSRTASTATSGSRDVTLLLNSMGDADDRAGYVAALRDVPAATTATRSATTFRERVEAEPAAGARLASAPTGRTSSSTRRSSPSTSATTPRAHFEAVQAGLDARSASRYELAPRLVRGLRLLHRHHVRVPERRARRRAERASAAAVATTGSPRRWAARPRPGIGFGIGIERVLIACDAEGVVPGADAGGRRVRGRRRSARRRPRSTLLVAELREDGLARRPRLRRPVGEGAVEGGRPVGRARTA